MDFYIDAYIVYISNMIQFVCLPSSSCSMIDSLVHNIVKSSKIPENLKYKQYAFMLS